VNTDVLHRLLTHYGFDVRLVINITDVGHLTGDEDEGEDKIEKGARREHKSVEEIIQLYTGAFLKDLSSLNIELSDIYRFPRASEHIEEQIKLIERLEEKGYTYKISDGLYFDTSKYPEYGALARLDIRNLREGARVGVNPEKRNPTDFALWKFSGEEKRLQEWDSPWGRGFPGWHIECSAMSMKYLGETFDIHTGGVDHIPVHHTNEIAQSVCATGKVFARYWLHHEFVNIEGAKMAKSDENFIRLQTLQDKGYSALDYRYLLLQAHYRTPIMFSFDSLEASANARKRLIHSYGNLTESTEAQPSEEYVASFFSALDDDLNTAEALSVLWNLLKDETILSEVKRATLNLFDSILGLGIQAGSNLEKLIEIPPEITELAQRRKEEKEAENYERADELRREIESKGFIIRDTKEGFEIEKQ